MKVRLIRIDRIIAGTLSVLSIIQLATILPALAEEPFNRPLDRTVQNLGLTRTDVSSDFEKLRAQPHEAVALLVAQLHPIVPKAYYPDHRPAEVQHIIDCLRALRYLTGTTFSARTSAKLSDDEKQFLDFGKEMPDRNADHKIHFFGVWMSRDAEFVAPEDAQRAIIEQWSKWQRDFGGTFQYRPAKSAADAMDDWYWYG